MVLYFSALIQIYHVKAFLLPNILSAIVTHPRHIVRLLFREIRPCLGFYLEK